MNRRDFLSSTFPISSAPSFDRRQRALPSMLYGNSRRTQSGLDPYVPTTQQPWDARRVGHLLRRSIFLPTWDNISTGLTMQPPVLVDSLLDILPEPVVPGAWVSEIFTKPVTKEEENAYKSRNLSLVNSLRAWWSMQMAGSAMNATEKLVLFWSGHITSEANVVEIPQFMYAQNALLRHYALGNFRELMKNVNHDAAMLRYLGGDINVGGNPNENYGRELMELFTMGEGHYTEQDIKEAARCLTGWRLDEFTALESYFSPLYHDTGNKTFMGKTIIGRDSLDGRFEGDEVVDIIFERDEVAKFICRKLYLAFVYNNPFAVDGDVVNGLADVFRTSNYDMKPVLATLFNSQHFHDDVNIGAMIKSPAVFITGLARQLGNPPSGDRMQQDMEMLEQHLMDPPTVQGWEDYRTWISTTTYPFRKSIAERFVTGSMPGGTSQTPMNVIAWAKSLPDFDDANKLIDTILLLLLPKPVSVTRREKFLNIMLGNAPVYEWNIDAPNADTNLRNLVVNVTLAPDFQQY